MIGVCLFAVSPICDQVLSNEGRYVREMEGFPVGVHIYLFLDQLTVKYITELFGYFANH